MLPSAVADKDWVLEQEGMEAVELIRHRYSPPYGPEPVVAEPLLF
jgi:hypothetical protein